MASILQQIGTEVGQELKTLSDRVTTLEGTVPAPTGPFTVSPVTWTNLTEINLSGEKLLNTDFSNTYIQYVADPDNDGSSTGGGLNPVKLIALADISLRGTIMPQGTILHGVGGGGSTNELIRMEDPNDPRDYPYTGGNQNTGTWDWEPLADRGTTWEFAKQENLPTNWSINGSTQLDSDKLAQGIIKGVGGEVSIQQMFSNPIASGTKLVAKATRADTNEDGTVMLQTLRSNGTPYGSLHNVPYADGYVEIETTETTYGLRLSTVHGTREISSISLFQGEVSGGSVQAFTGGSIEKISGVDGYNSGASSVQKIDGQSNGYVQFQIGTPSKSVRLGLVELDSDFEVNPPFQMIFGGGTIGLYNPWLGNYETYESGDWFRIRHYSANNEIHFQKREDVYQENTNASYEVGTKVLILRDFSSAVKDEIVTIYFVNNSGVPSFEQEDGTQFGAQAGVTGFGRADWWEVAETIGQDYKTFYTHPTFSNGNDLYFDTTFHTVGSRINDVQIAT